MKLYAGTSGFSYKEWKGTFYPEKLPANAMLAHYARKLPTVEINNTFYRLPRPDQLEPVDGETAHECAPGQIDGDLLHGQEGRPRAVHGSGTETGGPGPQRQQVVVEGADGQVQAEVRTQTGLESSQHQGAGRAGVQGRQQEREANHGHHEPAPAPQDSA